MRLGVVVQRYGTEVVGGAELHARWIAQRLAARHEVEVLTTCATDYLTWENVYPEGRAEIAGVRVRRFPVTKRRTAEGFDQLSGKVHFFAHSDRDEQRWMDEHGPVTPGLVDHLRKHHGDYDALVFFSYRYWTAYHGLQVAPQKSILVPTAEDDPTLGLRMFQPYFALPAAYALSRFRRAPKIALRMCAVSPRNALASRGGCVDTNSSTAGRKSGSSPGASSSTACS